MSPMLISVLSLTVLVVSGEKCQHPAPAPDYSNSLYAGRWYEVGKYQTLGGSIFQYDTVCTIATYQPYDMASGGGDIGKNLARRLTDLSCQDTPVVNTTRREAGLTPPGPWLSWTSRVTSHRASPSGASRARQWTIMWCGWTRIQL